MKQYVYLTASPILTKDTQLYLHDQPYPLISFMKAAIINRIKSGNEIVLVDDGTQFIHELTQLYDLNKISFNIKFDGIYGTNSKKMLDAIIAKFLSQVDNALAIVYFDGDFKEPTIPHLMDWLITNNVKVKCYHVPHNVWLSDDQLKTLLMEAGYAK